MNLQTLGYSACTKICHMTPRVMTPLTSGSPVSWLVWIRIFPSRMSLQTAIRACSIVSPALRMETPVIYTHTHARTMKTTEGWMEVSLNS